MKVFRLADTQDRVSEEGVAAGSRLVPTGSVFIVVRGMILAHTFPVCLAGRPMAFNQDVKGIVPRPGLRGEYLAHWFVTNADMMLSIVTEATHGTKRIDLADLHRQFIAVPATREQDAILEVMRIEEARLDHERNELSKFRLLKQGLTEDVLTGRVRVTALLDETPE
jgi:type I restriction enzyme S subunit